MPEGANAIYENLRIKPAENGWILKWTAKKPNPMMASSTFDNTMVFMDEKMVFEETKDVSNEAALDSALAQMKAFLLSNQGKQA